MGRAPRSGAVRRRFASARSPSEARVSELHDLVQAALGAATDGEQVEAYAEEERRTEVSALRGEVEGMTFAESRGVGVRVIRDERLGYAWAADPTEEEVRAAVTAARENAALAEPDASNVLPEPVAVETMPELYRAESASIAADDKVRMGPDPGGRFGRAAPA